jgi:two-component system response regulator YesN
MMKVLIVEDNPFFRDAFKKSLVEHFPSLVIEEATNGEEAIGRIDGLSPHLIFTDIRMPGINGLQFTKKIKKDFPEISVAVLTAYDLPEYRQAALQGGADRFFTKDGLKWEEIVAYIKFLESKTI